MNSQEQGLKFRRKFYQIKTFQNFYGKSEIPPMTPIKKLSTTLSTFHIKHNSYTESFYGPKPKTPVLKQFQQLNPLLNTKLKRNQSTIKSQISLSKKIGFNMESVYSQTLPEVALPILELCKFPDLPKVSTPSESQYAHLTKQSLSK